jgi:hypothetical protein
MIQNMFGYPAILFQRVKDYLEENIVCIQRSLGLQTAVFPTS